MPAREPWSNQQIKGFVENLIRAMVDHTEQVMVQMTEGTDTLILAVRLEMTDVPKIIGRQGRTIQSLRTVISGVGAKAGKRVSLEIIEDQPYVKQGG